MATWTGVHLLSKMKDKLFFTLMWWALLLAGIRVAYQLVELV